MLPPEVLGYLHQGPPRAGPGLVQLRGVLRRPGPAHTHVTAATVQLKATPQGRLGHELAEDADAAVPEGGLWEPSHHAPRPGLWVVGLHHVGEFKGIVVAPRDVELPSKDGQAAPYMHLWAKGGGEWRLAARAGASPRAPLHGEGAWGPWEGQPLGTSYTPTRTQGLHAQGSHATAGPYGGQGATLPVSSISPAKQA